MRVVRSRPAANFTQITNAVLRNHKLTHMARGVLAEMLSYPDGWSTTADDLWQRAARERPDVARGEGRRAYRAVFAELEKAGHLERHRLRTKAGQFETVLILHDEPATAADVPLAVSRSQPAETGSLPSSDRRTANGRSVSGTSSSSTPVPQHSERLGSSQMSLVASRRARPAVERDEDKIAIVQRAVILRGWDLAELEDEAALDIWARFIGERKTAKPVNDPVAFFYSAKAGTGVFSTFEYLDGVLANTPAREWDESA
jgi:hypothetical protein